MSAKRSRKMTRPRRAAVARARTPSRAQAPSRGQAVSRTRAAASRTPAPVASGSTAAAPRRRKLTAPRRELFTRLLLEERKRLRQELSEMEEHQVKTEEKPVADVSGGYDDDLVDVATETFEREKGLALESSVQGLLAMVEDALRRIRSGSYGVCDGCGRSIDDNRLRAIPYARLCIRCKEREERARSAAR